MPLSRAFRVLSWVTCALLASAGATGCATTDGAYRVVTSTTSTTVTTSTTTTAITEDVPAPPSSPEARCLAGDARDCVRLGEAYEDGLDGRTANLHLARWYYSAACGGGDARACDDAERLLEAEASAASARGTMVVEHVTPPAPLPPAAMPANVTVYGGIHVYGGNVTFGSVTNVVAAP